ncbi:AtzE family amidohydrolase [Asaia bogorensis]|uniref:Amidase n=1 Tax=Asaia bogorensis NBRC 16594 TaxID=1231624 RepID=A0AAN4R1M1_9PROT|nr:AtzE family amidohydrolase [Asaia bogorensis]BAT19987.1 amidase [Asaia bogorensis NBRC 16594]GBQ80865.1 amidase [Asaia bogorensis NBRC 16594]GEL52595.1 amidase [Asaia bogorensis NBRC 16594]
MNATEIARAVRSGERSAFDLIESCLDRVTQRDGTINAVTRLLSERALNQARRIDALVAEGIDPGPLAGVPFGIKDLFDVQGLVTTAGSKVLASEAPADCDALLVSRLIEAGAIPLATTNMDEFAYGFATDNAHYGMTKNPHDSARLAGGSSGGSAAGVAAGYFPLSLGSDTNGSIRVPASLCGVWGLRATQGLLPVSGSYPFVASLDTVGPFTASAADMRVMVEVLSASSLARVDVAGLKMARLGGWFTQEISPEMEAAFAAFCTALSIRREIVLPEVATARAAAFVISASEGAGLHLDRLRHSPEQYDPAVRDRLLAGALVPAPHVFRAHKIRHWFRERMHEAFLEADILVAPAVVGPAPRIDTPVIEIGGQPVSARANLGLYTQPLTLAGFPVLTVPLAIDANTGSGMPLGVQLVAQPGREDRLVALGEALERAGVARARILED